MPITVESFLRAQGFTANPFATTNAERELELLPAFFVPGESFDWLLGDPATPQSLILFAPQGCGKTCYRVELARRVSQRREHPALVVTVDDLAPLLRQGVGAVTLDQHIELIRRLTLDALDAHLSRAGASQGLMEREPETFAFFFGLLQLFRPRRTIGRTAPPNAEVYARAMQAEDPGPREWLRELAGLARAAGFSSIYCLYDGLDELQLLRDNPDNLFRLLGPLLDAPGLLDECSFAFRFFIPHTVADEMRRLRIGRLDRIPHKVLSWSDDQLMLMLARRLASYSRNEQASAYSRVTAFRDLCAVSFDVDRLLVQTAASSPRRLIDCARQLVEAHCLTASSSATLIDETTISRVLALPTTSSLTNLFPSTTVLAVDDANRGLPAQHAPDATPTLSADPASPPEPQLQADAVPVPPLHLDSWGDIWLGDRRLEAPMGGMMRRCLEYLWEHRQRRVAYDELIKALYGEDYDRRGDPQGSMEKLIKRLRKHLEPAVSLSHNYIKTQTGAGYVLQNFRDIR